MKLAWIYNLVTMFGYPIYQLDYWIFRTACTPSSVISKEVLNVHKQVWLSTLEFQVTCVPSIIGLDDQKISILSGFQELPILNIILIAFA